MEGTIFDIQHFCTNDGPGIRTTVFLKGCPLNCEWCHNPESSSKDFCVMFYKKLCISCDSCQNICPNINKLALMKRGIVDSFCKNCFKCTQICPSEALKRIGQKISADDLIKQLIKDKIYYETSGGGVTISGGEPLFQPDFCIEILKKIKEQNINTAIETSGYTTNQVIDRAAPFIDLAIWDIKAVTDDIYEKFTGVKFSIINDNLFYAIKKGMKIKLRFIFIPEIHGNINYMKNYNIFFNQLPKPLDWEIIPYHLMGNSKREAMSKESISKFTTPSNDLIKQFESIIKG